MDYCFHNAVLIRIPLLSYTDYNLTQLDTLLKNQQFQKALFLANPDFYRILEAKGFDYPTLHTKEQFTLARYYNRLSFRSTPLGLFASFCLTEWGGDSKLKLINNEQIKLHVLPDHKINYKLSQNILSQNLLNNTYTVNACIYQAYQEFRFIKTTTNDDNDRLTFAIESLKRNVFTDSLLTYCKKTLREGNEIIQFIIAKTGCDNYEAIEYLEFLVQSQILMPTQSLNITGNGFFFRAIENKTRQLANKTLLENIARNLTDPYLTLNQLKSLQKTLARLTATNNEMAFYTVSERDVLSGNVDTAIQSQLNKAFNALMALSLEVSNTSTDLDQFIKQFKLRYDEQKVPLLHAVDPEIGIGYSNTKQPDNALLPENVGVKESHDITQIQINWTDIHRLFMKLWCINRNNIFIPIIVTADDIKSLPKKNSYNYPPSLSIMFRKANGNVIIESAGGTSAIPIIGRFSMFNKQVENLCQDLANAEQRANPDVIFAELVQLSDLHVDNINRRKFIYNYEIPINVISLKPTDQQIQLSDLWLSVVNNELILESSRLGKRIIPRHSTAYNAKNNNLGVFRLLSDMQPTGLKTNFSFSLEALFPGLEFYPRVQFENVILSPAKWSLGTTFIENLKKCSNVNDELQLFKGLQQKWQLPQHIALSKFDQFLVFNTNNIAEIQFLLNNIKTLKALRIEEYIVDKTPTVYTGYKPSAAQYIAFLQHNKPVYNNSGNNKTPLYHLKRKYIPGSEWLYLKIYCNETFVNKLLAKQLLPLLKNLLKSNTIKSWFFVRYHDSGSHLRLRMHLCNNADCGLVLKIFNDKLNDIVHYRLIKEYMADSYQPELERYGTDLISITEKFFYASSVLISEFILRSANSEDMFTFHNFAIITTNDIADIFIPCISDKIEFYKKMSDIFYKEFASNKQLRIEMDMKYRDSKQCIINAFINYNNFKSIRLSRHHNFFKNSINELAIALNNATPTRRSQMLADAIHMHINRIFTSNQRAQELMVYYYLYKYSLYSKSITNNSI